MVKFKNRYLLVRFSSSDGGDGALPAFRFDLIKRAFAQAMTDMHGDVGASAALHTMNVKVYAERTNIAVVRIRRECERQLASAVPFVRLIDHTPVTVE